MSSRICQLSTFLALSRPLKTLLCLWRKKETFNFPHKTSKEREHWRQISPKATAITQQNVPDIRGKTEGCDQATLKTSLSNTRQTKIIRQSNNSFFFLVTKRNTTIIIKSLKLKGAWGGFNWI